MRSILITAVLFFSLSSNAQNDTSQIKFADLPDSTGIGTPNGNLISRVIGPDGGNIVSDDGKVELIFPPDALEKNTSISIQPATNPAPNGTGKSYQFEPSGIEFKKPVKLFFIIPMKKLKLVRLI